MIETNLALALRHNGQTSLALEWLERAASREPAFVPALCELATLLLALERPEDAESVIARGLEVAPNTADFSVLLGGIRLNRADWDGARLAFARALVIQPGHPTALHGLGAALMERGEFAEAAERFRRALAADGGDLQSRLSFAACQLEVGRADEGIASLREACRKSPQAYPAALKILVTSARGRFWLRPSAAATRLRASHSA